MGLLQNGWPFPLRTIIKTRQVCETVTAQSNVVDIAASSKWMLDQKTSLSKKQPTKKKHLRIKYGLELMTTHKHCFINSSVWQTMQTGLTSQFFINLKLEQLKIHFKTAGQNGGECLQSQQLKRLRQETGVHRFEIRLITRQDPISLSLSPHLSFPLSLPSFSSPSPLSIL